MISTRSLHLLLALGLTGMVMAQTTLPESTQPTSAPAATSAATTSTAPTTAPAPSTALDRPDDTNRSSRRQRGDRSNRYSRNERETRSPTTMPARSIFTTIQPPPESAGGSTTQPVAISETQPAGTRRERNLVFNGVTILNGTPLAFVEDTSVGDVLELKVGDAVAEGKIAGITFDQLDYLANGRTTQIAVGQNLAGGDAPAAIDRPVSNTISSTSGTQPTTGPSESDAARLERLRARRRAGE